MIALERVFGRPLFLRHKVVVRFVVASPVVAPGDKWALDEDT